MPQTRKVSSVRAFRLRTLARPLGLGPAGHAAKGPFGLGLVSASFRSQDHNVAFGSIHGGIVWLEFLLSTGAINRSGWDK